MNQTNLVNFVLEIPNISFGYLNLLSVAHALIVAWDFRRSHKIFDIPVLQAMFATFVCAVGGTSTTALITGIPLGWLSGNNTIPTYIVIPLMVYYSPFDIVFKLLESIRMILYPILFILDAISNAFSIVAFGVDGVRNHPSGKIELQQSIGALLLCGTLSGCGGGLWASAFSLKEKQWRFETPASFKRISSAIWIAFLTAFLYVFLTGPTSVYISFAPKLTVEQWKAYCILSSLILASFDKLFTAFSTFKLARSDSNDIGNDKKTKLKMEKEKPKRSKILKSE